MKLTFVVFKGIVEPIGFLMCLYRSVGLRYRDTKTGLTIGGELHSLMEVSLYVIIKKGNDTTEVIFWILFF